MISNLVTVRVARSASHGVIGESHFAHRNRNVFQLAELALPGHLSYGVNVLVPVCL